jgi:hypothetical protein
MNLDRTKAIEAAEAAYHQEKAREAAFRTWLSAHLGPDAGNQEADVIISTDARGLSDERLALQVMFASGCPPGYSLSDEQIDIAARAVLGSAAL